MKLSAFSALFFVFGASLVFLTFSIPIVDGSWFPDLFGTNYGERRTVIAISRKLRESMRGIGSNYKGSMGSVALELDDYNPINPMPDAKHSVKGGTIEHGQPIGPYKPQPTPPSPPPADADGGQS